MEKLKDAGVDLTAFPAQGSQRRGAVIVCPGGGYVGLAAHEAEPVAEWLNRQGLTAFILRYRVAPHRHPAPLEDAARAVRYVRYNAARWQVDPQHIGILGFSAGGHLASTLGTHFDAGNPAAADPVERVSSRPDALILCYPVISLVKFGHRGSLENLVGGNASEELLGDLSNELQVTAETPPAFLWHTAADETVPVEQSLLFADALGKHGVPFELHVFPAGQHGLGLADETSKHCPPWVAAAQWTKLCEVWLKGLGF
jgi:acetyl esterase/lipase